MGWAGVGLKMKDIAEHEWLSVLMENSFAAGNVAVESKLLQKGGQLGLSAGSVAGKNAVAVPSRPVRKNAIVYHCL